MTGTLGKRGAVFRKRRDFSIESFDGGDRRLNRLHLIGCALRDLLRDAREFLNGGGSIANLRCLLARALGNARDGMRDVLDRRSRLTR